MLQVSIWGFFFLLLCSVPWEPHSRSRLPSTFICISVCAYESQIFYSQLTLLSTPNWNTSPSIGLLSWMPLKHLNHAMSKTTLMALSRHSQFGSLLKSPRPMIGDNIRPVAQTPYPGILWPLPFPTLYHQPSTKSCLPHPSTSFCLHCHKPSLHYQALLNALI